MSNTRRFTFSLLRLLLSITAIAAVLAIGRWRDCPLPPIVVAAATAGLLMFVIQRRHLPVLFFEGVASLLGIAITLSLTADVRPGRTEYTDLMFAIYGALMGWFLAWCCVRGAEMARSPRDEGPEDVISSDESDRVEKTTTS